MHKPLPLSKVGQGGGRGGARFHVAHTGPHQLKQDTVHRVYGSCLYPSRPKRHRQLVHDLKHLYFGVHQLYVTTCHVHRLPTEKHTALALTEASGRLGVVDR